MRFPTVPFLVACVMASSPLAQQPEAGIAQSLARSRSSLVSDIRYELHFDLRERMQTVEGTARLLFDLPEATLPDAPVILDFAGELVGDPAVNGFPRGDDAVRRVHDHLVLAPDTLVPGRNSFEAHINAEVAAAGAPLTSYRSAEGEELVYTLLVPADAHRLFPCFDQPDLKGIFQLTLTVPSGWTAVANAPAAAAPEQTEGGNVRWEFADTKPLSTYLFAFAAGPFDVIDAGTAGDVPLRIFVRPERRSELDAAAVAALHRDSLRWLDHELGIPYPFGKLDAVLLPGFPYGGMEHAGAIFYSEPAVVFDHPPIERELTRRSTLVYHEVTHQWFGNLVTMSWFDDLWLKEGFATFVSYLLLHELQPERHAWIRFSQQIKLAALRIDATAGTTPVYQDLQNLAAAKSNYGAIVYAKAPAVLHELYERVGRDTFLAGVRRFLENHAFGNATWQDLVGALKSSADRDLDEWSKSWILTGGMPVVRVRWQPSGNGTIDGFEVVQEDVRHQGRTWPIRVELLLLLPDGAEARVVVDSHSEVASVPELRGKPVPLAVIPNPNDVSYALFLLDARSREYLLQHLPSDELTRAVVLAELMDGVREAELRPERFADLALDRLAAEDDPETHSWLLDRLHTIIWRYLAAPVRDRVIDDATKLLSLQIRQRTQDVGLQSFRFLAWTSPRPSVLDLCERLLAEDADAPLELGMEDRYLALAALIAGGHGSTWAARMTGDHTPTGAERYAFLAQAAEPDRATKDRYFATYLQPHEPPEQWVQESLSYFHWPGQDELTLPYLDRALDRLEWVSEHRKIFFMPAWIDGFVNGHSSPAALRIVQQFLTDHQGLPPDIERKVLQSLDALQRAVAIKERWE